MNKRIIAIYDACGKLYMDCSRSAWFCLGFEITDMDIGTALSDSTFLDDYHLITLTMGHECCKLYREYVLMLRSETSIPIALFPYGDLPTQEEASTAIYAGASQVIPMPTVLDSLIANCYALIMDYTPKSLSNAHNLTLYADYKFVLDENGYRAYVDNHVIRLSETEFRLLRLLMEHRGIFVKSEEIISEIWGKGYKRVPDNVLHNQVKRIRIKLLWNDSLPRYIESGYGKGYRFWPHYPNSGKPHVKSRLFPNSSHLQSTLPRE